MHRPTILYFLVFVCFATGLLAQKPREVNTDVEILKAEDARRFDAVLEKYLEGNLGEKYTVRSLLAAGRIGDERAVPVVAAMLSNVSVKVREMAAFTLGEIESAKGSDAILNTLADPKISASVREHGPLKLPERSRPPILKMQKRRSWARRYLIRSKRKTPKARARTALPFCSALLPRLGRGPKTPIWS